jgi:hypothetical protein
MSHPTDSRAPSGGRLDSRPAGGPDSGRHPEQPKPTWPPSQPPTPVRPRPGPLPNFARAFIESLEIAAHRKAVARAMAEAARPREGRP